MQIEFSKQEFRTFLEVLEIAEWVLNAHQTDSQDDREIYSDFEQKIFSHAKAFGFDDLIEYAEDDEKYYPTKKHDDNSNVMLFIEEFETDSFWENLIGRMVRRDLVRKFGKRKSSMIDEKVFIAFQKLEEKYMDEFETHDLNRLEVKE